MHRVDTDGHVANKFTDGNPVFGQRATVVDAAILNAVQEAICLVVEGAGIVLSKGDDTQLYDAIVALIAGVVGTGGGSVPTTRLVSAGGLLTGGGNLAADRTISLAKATPAEAAAGVLDDRAVTPLGLAGLISVTGGAGVMVFKAGPAVFQFFAATVAANGTTILSLPESFPTECVSAICTGGKLSTSAQDNNPIVSGVGLSNISIFSAEDLSLPVYVAAFGR